ncbi:hypothetical protein YA0024_24470 [Pseudomonas syringae]|uniref:Uncharacterized protein n=1 Tax=Pseudomonas syringae TaxID=317 RepID=A0AB37ZVV8_PSESX|nr:hypothetical protein [Pseudomonas syringae]MBI6665230.1 hypothetical protein [Pseudomonas syringae]MBI6676891.1 hypothetical protein [Pseudomonas syringae]MBI6839677.1 hypothetical protein [Pseudomonas syringae]SDO12524.1 hypothetical protein SAMN05444505_11487 [Pseudomonas syringae]
MTTEIADPFYLDWKFWSLVVSLLALALSQLPPIHLLIRPRRLDVEVHSRIQLLHRAGNPNVVLVVGITNSGGRDLRVRSMQIELKRDGQALAVLPAQCYFETPSSSSTVLLVPFVLKPNESWAHGVAFFQMFDRQTEKSFREHLSLLKADIRHKIDSRTSESNGLVEAAPELVAHFTAMFDRLFIWQTGEYIASLSVTAEPGSASYSKKYRFTVYEADTADLRAQITGYKYGAGIAYDQQEIMVTIPLTEHIS